MRQIQATWLAESGVERAIFSLRHNPEYSQEVWRVTPEQLDGQLGARVDIQVVPRAAADSFVTIDVSALYPYPSDYAVRARRRITVARTSIEQVGLAPEALPVINEESERAAEE